MRLVALLLLHAGTGAFSFTAFTATVPHRQQWQRPSFPITPPHRVQVRCSSTVEGSAGISRKAALRERRSWLPLSRREALEGVVGILALALPLAAAWPGRAAAAAAETQGFVAADGSYQLTPPPGFVAFRKPLKTHLDEATFKSEKMRGYQVGVAVDPIKIDSLERFGSAEDVGGRVVAVERAKDGTLEAKLVSARRNSSDGSYTIEYAVDSTRGKNRFVAKVAIRAGRLYACTGQSKEDDFAAVGEELTAAVDSFRVLAAQQPPPP